ncbi:MAG: universal stress protein [Pirellulaceae bacterium]
MAYQRILCPVDLSEFSREAIKVASSMAKAGDGKVIFLFVAMPELPHSAGAAISEVDHVIEEQRHEFDQVKPTIDGVECEHVLIRGEPIHVIVDYVKENDIDLVVMPTHGRSGLLRLLMGSVAEHVVRKAPCPVLVIKTPE